MKIHHLKPAKGATQSKKRMARGDRGKGGKTAGRGTKGTGARGTVPAWFEGGQTPLVRRQPKRPGFTNPNKVVFTAINLALLEDRFDDGDTVSRESLSELGLVRKKQPIKILGHGDITKKLTVTGVAAISATAREKIEAAGGTVEV